MGPGTNTVPKKLPACRMARRAWMAICRDGTSQCSAKCNARLGRNLTADIIWSPYQRLCSVAILPVNSNATTTMQYLMNQTTADKSVVTRCARRAILYQICSDPLRGSKSKRRGARLILDLRVWLSWVPGGTRALKWIIRDARGRARDNSWSAAPLYTILY